MTIIARSIIGKFMEVKRPPVHIAKALPFVVLASLIMALQAVFVKLVSPLASIEIIVFFRFLMCFCIFFVSIKLFSKRTIRSLFKTEKIKLQLLRSILGTLCAYGFYYATIKLPLPSVMVLLYAFPLYVPIISRIWFGYRIKPSLWVGIITGFFGIVLVTHPGDGVFELASIVLIFVGIFNAIAILCIRTIHYTEDTVNILAYFFTIATVLSGIVLLVRFPYLKFDFSGHSVVLLILVGVATCLAQYLFTKGFRFAPARLMSPFMFTSVIFSYGFQFIFQDKFPAPLAVIGMGVIVLGIVLLVFLYPKDDLAKAQKRRKTVKKR